MYELPKRVQSHILPGVVTVVPRPVFWGLDLCMFKAVLSAIIQMVSRGFTSHEFAGRSSFGIELANPSDTMLA